MLFVVFNQIAKLKAQTVGLVFSGGGSSGVAHIGVLKALEEYNIPIDYIAGTSIGGLIGGLYAAGYSPAEIEALFVSDEFKQWTQGIPNDKYIYYLRQKPNNPAMLNFKINTNALWEVSIPTNLISPNEINFGLMQRLAPASALAKDNFDSLFIPFRCVASDIISKKPIIIKKGELSTAVRASMAYPFYLTPIETENQLLFDGGLYNNFPSDVMYNDFNPDFIIGSNVSYNFPKPEEDNVISQIKSFLTYDTKYEIPCEYSVLIEPDATDYATFDFTRNAELIQLGYDETVKYINTLYDNINRRIDYEQRQEERKKYNAKLPQLTFKSIEVVGLTDAQNHYVEKSLRLRKDTLNAKNIEPQFIKVLSDDKIKSIYPRAIYNDTTNTFKLRLETKKEKNLFVSFGGVISSRPVSTGYVGVQYNLLRRVAHSFSAEAYFGRLTNSFTGGYRLDVPGSIPFYWQTSFTTEKWDYFRSNSTFFEDTKPSFLISNEQYAKTELGLPLGFKNKVLLGATFGELDNEYYQTRQFLSTDTTDETTFKNVSVFLNFESNSLDLKQYATKGRLVLLEAKYINGRERTVPGSTSVIKDVSKANLDWILLKAKVDNYFNKKGWIRFGVLAEAVYSTQPFFENYTASVLSASAFQPITESVTLFQEKLRAKKYIAGGAKSIINVYKNTQVRVEGYVFQPFQEILQNELKKGELGKEWATREYIFSTSLVYQTPLGPLAFNVNYFERQQDQWSFLFHFGYFIFNKKNLQ